MTNSDSNKLPINRKLLTRLFSKIRLSTEYFYNGSACWEWLAFRDKDGYGKIGYTRIDGSCYTPAAHHLMYNLFVEIIPNHLVADHLCRRRWCANPAHVEPITSKENTLRSPIAPASINAQKTHCLKGHPFTTEHLATSPSHVNVSHRVCRTCYNQWQRTDKQRKRKRLWMRQKRAKLKNLT